MSDRITPGHFFASASTESTWASKFPRADTDGNPAAKPIHSRAEILREMFMLSFLIKVERRYGVDVEREDRADAILERQ